MCQQKKRQAAFTIKQKTLRYVCSKTEIHMQIAPQPGGMGLMIQFGI